MFVMRLVQAILVDAQCSARIEDHPQSVDAKSFLEESRMTTSPGNFYASFHRVHEEGFMRSIITSQNWVVTMENSMRGRTAAVESNA